MRTLILTLAIFSLYFSATSQNVLVFTKTGHYRHACLPNAIKSFVEMGEENGWKCTFTEDASFITADILNKFDVVVFLLTNKDILDNIQKEAFKNYIKSGKGFVGIHSATVTELNWPWFGNLIGARFIGHSGVQKGKITIEDNTHPATKHLKKGSIVWEDEWYSLNKTPRGEVNVLISLNEDSIEMKNFHGKDMTMGDHPLAWYHIFEDSRVFQTQLGHRPEIYDDPIFRKHIIGAIHWASKRE